MSRNDKITNIISYMRQAEIKPYETTPDYFKIYVKAIHPFYDYQERENEFCFLPKYEEILNYLFSQRTSEKFFNEFSLTLDKIIDFLNETGNYEAIYLTKKINILIEKSFKVIKKMYSIFGLKFDIEDYRFSNIIYDATYLITDDKIVSSALELIDKLKKLSTKIQIFIRNNNIYSGCYKVDLKYKEIKKNLYEKLRQQISNINQILNKSYVVDFFSDGNDEVKEMCTCLFQGLAVLCNIKKDLKEYKFSYQDVIFDDLNSFFKMKLSDIYLFFNNLNAELFSHLDDIELSEKYRLLRKIKPVREIGYDYRYFATTKGEEELFNLIGLYPIKDSIKKIKSYALANKDDVDNLNLHMAFYGNPGTGKTEVARTIGKILYEAGVLTVGHVVEVSRKDLVGQYIGETPYLTQNCINRAMGGVLFIDEAYSLASKDSGFDYGKEAISTLLKAMEDRRGEFCVIFAGYKNELEEMISTNPGLKSRIQFNLNFSNYSKEELEDIFELMLQRTKYTIEESAKERILDLLEYKKKDPRFANAREVRNILEQVIMNLNVRNSKSVLITLDEVKKYENENELKVLKSKNDIILTGEQELEQLIGLESVKRTIRKIKAFAKKNKDNADLNLHMCFTGNPGTGKTEVARIISRILYDVGVLKEAKLIETNSNGLIGKYVGETGPKTEKMVNNALNGVLFIDEAYALNQADNKNSYGDEAISTLIKEMEDKRGRFCVILAGYKNEMNDLLDSNPGFDSRIQFHIDFPDYTNEELQLIARKMISNMNYVIEDNALDMIIDIVDLQRHEKTFANARTLRNILDKIILNQNLRTEESNDNKIIVSDVENYINENTFKNVNISEKNIIDFNYLYNEYNEFDTDFIDDKYLEQTVISISGSGGEGTGFIISKDGLCLTCNHCISGDGTDQQARIIYNLGRKKIKTYSSFKVLYKDELNDFALIQLDDQDNEYDFLPLAPLDYNYKPLNEFIMAGYPFGGETFTSISITDGKIASENIYNGREVVFANMFGKPGNSGSPILDKTTMKVIGLFWGGIKKESEMIHCFTSIKTIINLLK